MKIDRIDTRSNIVEHLTDDGKKTLCGLGLWMTQDAAGNKVCKNCVRLETLRTRKLEAAMSSGQREELAKMERGEPVGGFDLRELGSLGE